MRKLALLTIGLLPAAVCAQTQLEIPLASPKAYVSQVVGLTEVKITYCRPGVKGRLIWGSLVPYDQIWRTGANEATTISFSTDVTIEGQPLPAGTYALFTIPGRTEWTVILNKGSDQWGAYTYKQELDALRLKVKPRPAAFCERMMFSIPVTTTDSAVISLNWEKLQMDLNIKVDVVGRVLETARKAIAEAKPDDWRTPFRAASFCVDNNVNLPEAANWIEKALAASRNYYTLFGKARVLSATGKRAEAIALARQAIETGKAAEPKNDTAPAELALADWEKAKDKPKK